MMSEPSSPPTDASLWRRRWKRIEASAGSKKLPTGQTSVLCRGLMDRDKPHERSPYF
jgi:hypothetical protein